MTLVSLLAILGFLTLCCVFGALAALMLDLWDRAAERRELRRGERQRLRGIFR